MTAKHKCRDCDRTQLEPDMLQDGRGDWFCKPCWTNAVESDRKRHRRGLLGK